MPNDDIDPFVISAGSGDVHTARVAVDQIAKTIINKADRPSWLSLKNVPTADADFLAERPDITATIGNHVD